MIKNKIIIIISLFFRIFFIKIFIHKLNNKVVHVAFIKLGGLSKLIEDLMVNYNLLTVVENYIILYICGIPFMVCKNDDNYVEKLNKIIGGVCPIYHIHQLSNNLYNDYEFFKDKNYIINLHDYYLICERFFMLSEKFEFCNLDNRCCRDINRVDVAHDILNCAKFIIIPDDSMLEYLNKYFSDITFTIIPHGV